MGSIIDEGSVYTMLLFYAEIFLKTSYFQKKKLGKKNSANSKYVNSVLITEDTGLITITYNPTAVGVGANANTITLTPWVRSGAAGGGQAFAAALAAGASGSLDWGCASSTNAQATADGITVLAAGTMEPNFAPAQCR